MKRIIGKIIAWYLGYVPKKHAPPNLTFNYARTLEWQEFRAVVNINPMEVFDKERILEVVSDLLAKEIVKFIDVRFIENRYSQVFECRASMYMAKYRKDWNAQYSKENELKGVQN